MADSLINSIATATKYTDALDKRFVQKAVTGFMTDNTFGAKFVGAKSVIIPDVDFVGLADYDKDNGFSRGKMTVNQSTYELTKDRGRSIQIDRMDMDETGIANLAGQILSEFVRTMVVPECDAYILSKLYGIAAKPDPDNLELKQVITYTQKSEISQILTAINNVRNAAGYDEELVAFVNSDIYGKIMNSTEFSRNVVISDFKQGDLNFKVKTIDGVAIIPVSKDRMMTNYVFEADGSVSTKGGFTPADGATEVKALILPKKAASVVRKTEKLRVFTPEQNLDADAYKFDYRIYYDVFVKKSNRNAIWAIG